MQRPFLQVDVFSSEPYKGNPLAVVVDGEGLTTDQMQQFTRWTNLSEATFLLPPTTPDADYRVRIFTPSRELGFAGHPTLGSCHAWLESGGSTTGKTVVQECGAGLVPVRQVPEGLAFKAPPLLRAGPVSDSDLAHVIAILDIDADEVLEANWTDNGPGWVSVLLAGAAAVLAVRPRTASTRAINIGVVGLYPDGSDEAIEVRAFSIDQRQNLREDPVTGSLNAALAQWLLASGTIEAPYTARQGTVLGRQGRPRISVENSSIWVGGPTTTCIRGQIEL